MNEQNQFADAPRVQESLDPHGKDSSINVSLHINVYVLCQPDPKISLHFIWFLRNVKPPSRKFKCGVEIRP